MTPEVATFGETMAVLSPEGGGPLEAADRFSRTLGGAESNFATALARLGHAVAYFTRLGDDGFGRYILKTLRGEGIDVSGVELDSGAPTGLMFKEVLFGAGRGGETRVSYYRRFSAASALTLPDLAALKPKFVFATGITPALSEHNREETLRALEHLAERRIPVAFDPNMRFKLWSADQARPVLRHMASLSDLALPGTDEGELLTGERTPEGVAAALLELGARRVVVKLGTRGAYFSDGTETGFVDAYPAREVDPLGAGDAFSAGVVSGLLDGLTLKEASRRGCALGALCVTARGDTTALPTRRELEDFQRGEYRPPR